MYIYIYIYIYIYHDVYYRVCKCTERSYVLINARGLYFSKYTCSEVYIFEYQTC